MKKIEIPSSVEIIEDDSFGACENLEHVIFDNERNFFTGAFSYCHKLNINEISGHINKWNIDGNRLLGYVPDNDEFEVIIPEGISEIEENAFAKANWIKKIVLPSALRIIEKEAFFHFIYLEEVVISEGIEVIGEKAFEGCYNLRKINLPASLRKIGKNSFNLCARLNELIIPDGIKYITEYCFAGCENLSHVRLPENVERIGKNSFAGCTKLIKVDNIESAKEIDNSAFENCNMLTK